MILPYPGQNDPQVLQQPVEKAAEVSKSVPEVSNPQKTEAIGNIRNAERKTISQPTGKLNTRNVGIESILNPPKRNNAQEQESVLIEKNETYTQEQFAYAWKEYALGIKRQKKDSLFATLMNSEKTINSEHVITLNIQNSIQETELELDKGDFVRFLRTKLSNTNIDLRFIMSEQKSVQVMDSKATFDKLAEENSSLNKFRKLFNLDIEY